MIDHRVRALYYMKLLGHGSMPNDPPAKDYLIDLACRVADDIGGTTEGNLIFVDGREVTNIVVKDLIYDSNMD